MNRFNSNSFSSAAACATLALVAGLATSASAIDRSWNCAGGAWTTDGCWTPLGRPGNGDVARFGNLPSVQNVIVHLDANEVIAGLHIDDGMTFDTDNHTLDVNGSTTVSGRNVVGMSVYPSRLRIDQAVDGPDFFTNSLTLSDYAEIDLNGGGISASNFISVGSDCIIGGSGTVQLTGGGTTFANNGEVRVDPSSLSFSQTGGGRYDLDGTTGDGVLNLSGFSGTTLAFQGVGLADTFGGDLFMISGTVLAMNLSEGWVADADSVFNIYGSGSGAVTRIAGMALDFDGTINLYGGSDLSLESDTTFQVNSEMVFGNLANVDIAGDVVINGGLFTLNQDSNLDFDAPTRVNGGSFITHSDESTTGSVDFNGATTWAGNVSVSGFARQNGPARVAAATVITGDTFDMDGSNDANWDLDANLTLNVDRIDYNGNTLDTTLDIGAGRITVNLPGSNEWTVAGTMNLSGNNLLFSTKIDSGSPLRITGEVNVLGKTDIATDTTVFSTTTINIPAATSALRFFASSLIGANVTFTGTGLLQNATNREMTINSGLNTNGVGLHNTGILRVGAGPGIMSVDRLHTSGVWIVDVGWHNPGTEHDRIVSNGPVTLGGVLEVNLVDAGLGGVFHPVVGNEFTILNAVGGITGVFAPDVTTTIGTTIYHWEVVVGSADVVLRLASIETPCRADFNQDGFVNSQDFFDFLTAFFALNPSSDINEDAFVNSQDFFDFLTAFFAGC